MQAMRSLGLPLHWYYGSTRVTQGLPASGASCLTLKPQFPYLLIGGNNTPSSQGRLEGLRTSVPQAHGIISEM